MIPDTKQIQTLLQNAKRPVLAEILGKFWEMPLVEYANHLWENPVSAPTMEKALRDAFETEFCRTGLSKEQAQVFCERLEKTRVIQTATHLTASEGPTFLALHHLALLGMPPQETYFVGAYSGVPFANSAWSGCLNFSNRFELEDVIASQAPGFSALKRSDSDRSRDSAERRISLIPGNMRDASVFQSKVSEKLANLRPYFAEPIRNVSPFVSSGEDFTVWASQFCANQLRKIIPDKSLQFFDLNEVIRNYLKTVLHDSAHPLHRLLFNRKIRETVFEEFPSQTPIFTVEVLHKNKIRQESVVIQGEMLNIQNFQLELTQENIVRELETGRLCPGLFLVFTTLSFINGMICFGSFEQVEYLAEFRRRWLKLDFLEQEVVRTVNICALTSGRCVDETEVAVHPLDLLLGFEWSFAENKTVGELMKPLLPRLGVVV
ncbi:MAG: hypothetical protein MK515_01745 [SAR324 cluster bacterium]|jgi:hypothetical protein|nr:hypothetical protein [SAR324 cluster bacterium]